MAQKGFINRKAASPGGHLLSPENPKAVATGPRSIRLNWEPPPGNPMGYKVHEISLIRPWNNIYQTHWLLIGHSNCRSEQISLNHAWFFWLLCMKKNRSHQPHHCIWQLFLGQIFCKSRTTFSQVQKNSGFYFIFSQRAWCVEGFSLRAESHQEDFWNIYQVSVFF